MLWTDLRELEIGYETRASVIENVSFENITVLHANHKPVCSFTTATARWSGTWCSATHRGGLPTRQATAGVPHRPDDDQVAVVAKRERGNIRNVLLENVSVLSGKVPPCACSPSTKPYA